MGNMKVHYISFYLDEKEIFGRRLEVAAQNKIKYILKVLRETEYHINLISTSFNEVNNKYSGEKTILVNFRETHKYLSTISTKYKITSKLKLIYMELQLFKYLLFNVNRKDVVIVYHSLSYINIIRIFKKIKKFSFILELNDFYSLHFTDNLKSKYIDSKEKKFFNLADGYILASPFMSEFINNRKPFIINYGNYETKDTKNRFIRNDKIHVAYTGVIENLRGAAKLAVNSSRFLNYNYQMHIAGYGTEENINEIIKLCDQINSDKGYKVVIFHGLLLGDKFDELLNKCLISLNTHSYQEDEIWKSKYSFPSKIPLAMSYDNYIVSHNMILISTSPFNDCTEYFEDFDPLNVANAIQKCAMKILKKCYSKSPRKIIQELDMSFTYDLINMIKEVSKS